MPRTFSLQAVCTSIPGLSEDTLQVFLREDWVRPARQQGEPVFSDGDVARIRLILDLRATLEVEEQTLPIVLSLVDQLYATRRTLRRLIEQAGPETRELLAGVLQEP